MDDGAEDTLSEDYYETKFFKIVHARYQQKINFDTFPKIQIFKLVKNFEAHGSYEDHRATGSSLSGHLIIQEECAQVKTLHSILPLTEQQTPGVCTLELLLTFGFMLETK